MKEENALTKRIKDYASIDLNTSQVQKSINKVISQFKRSKTLLKPANKLTSDGYNEIIFDKIKIKYAFFKGCDEQLHVFLSGAARSPDSCFSRWSFNQYGNTLAIADPMLTMHGIGLGWYFGTIELDYRYIISNFIKKVAQENNISYNNIIIYGSSGGGTAAIYIGSYIEGCTILAGNPQFDITKWSPKHINALESFLGTSINDSRIALRNDMEKILKNNNNSNILLLINCLSEVDLEQYKKFSTLFSLPINLGISKSKNITVWVYEALGLPGFEGIIDNHASIDDIYIFNIIEEFIQDTMSKCDINNQKYLQYTLLWRYIFELKFNQYRLSLIANIYADSGKNAYILSDIYKRGTGVKIDVYEFDKYITLSAKLGYPPALLEIYKIAKSSTDQSIVGKYTEIIQTKAVNNKVYCNYLVDIYTNSLIAKNIDYAIYWQEISLDNGDTNIKNYLNLLWKSNSKLNDEKLVKFCNEQIVELNDPYCYAFLGLAQRYGRGTDKNDSLAKSNLEIANHKEVGVAQNALLDLLYENRNLNNNLNELIELCNKLTKNNPRAKQYLELISTETKNGS